MKIRIDIDTRAVLKLSATVLRQMEFATAQALNDVIKGAQRDRREALPRTFTIRSSQSQRFLERFIKIPRGGFAKKGKLYADIVVTGPDVVNPLQSQSKILTRHERGGTFAPGINPFFIPSDYLRAGNKPIPRSLYPAALGINLRRAVSGGFAGGKAKGKRRTFAIGPQFGHNVSWSAIYQREGSGPSSETNLLWLLINKPIRIPPRLGFVRGVSDYARREFGPAFRRRFEQAIRGELK